MNNCFIILAAGKSNRFISKTPKPFVQYNGDILIKHSINKAILSKKFSKIVVAINKNHKKYLKKLKLNKVLFVNGGKTRADSAKNCLNYIKKYKPKNVFIHDAARPNFSLNLIVKLLKALKFSDGVIPVIQSIDTPKLKINKQIHNLDRKKIFFSQTPQAFKYKVLMKLQNKISEETTDDSSLLIGASKKIKLIKGEEKNHKITTLKDITENKVFYGIGFDVHRLVPKRKMYLGGIKINSKLGTLGHSDGDPILHAITDAILGACRMGDIGEKFSNKNKRYKNIRSTILLNKVIKDIKSKNFNINNIDINVITETPKLNKIKKKIILSISKLCRINKNKINLKGKTAEKLGVIGKEKAIACEVIASIEKIYD
tara:strand:- start:1345 stop:2460 length:1116 start_codon:yes stop_codon:yes gene_type:complete